MSSLSLSHRQAVWDVSWPFCPLCALRCEWELDRDSLRHEQRCSESDRAAPRDSGIGPPALSDVHCAQEPCDKDYAVWKTSGIRWGRREGSLLTRSLIISCSLCSLLPGCIRTCDWNLVWVFVFFSVCADNNHVRTWTVTRFRGMISTQPGSTPLASFKILSLEETESHGSYCSGNDIGERVTVRRKYQQKFSRLINMWAVAFNRHKSGHITMRQSGTNHLFQNVQAC